MLYGNSQPRFSEKFPRRGTDILVRVFGSSARSRCHLLFGSPEQKGGPDKGDDGAGQEHEKIDRVERG